MIEQVVSTSVVDIDQLNYLLKQRSPDKSDALTEEDTCEAFKNPNFFLFVAKEIVSGREQIVGLASIFFQRNLARWMAEIHDVVVDKDFRGGGLGKLLVQELLYTAEAFANEYNEKIKLYLTCRPSRIAANLLYPKLGFTLVAKAEGTWGTNLYKMIVNPTCTKT